MDHSRIPSDVREQLVEALTREHYRRARERIEASPEDHCAALADAVLPVVEEALAEAERNAKRERWAVRMATQRAYDADAREAEADARAARAEVRYETERAAHRRMVAAHHKAETERAELADRNRDLDTQLTRERQQRLAAEAEARVARADLGKERATIGRLTAELHAALDTDQPKEAP